MGKILAIILISGTLLYASSCGDPSKRPGKEAGQEHNADAGVPGDIDEMEDSWDSTGNFHPRQKGGSTPSDEKGNY